MLEIQENVTLKDYTTFKIGGPAKYFVIAKDEADLHEAFIFAKSRKLPIFILGGGSNLLVPDHGFSGLVVKNEIKGIKFMDEASDQVILEVGAGEILDEIITLSVMRNLFGLENLSGIPGTVGGAAVQNAGAYGAELKDCLLSVTGLNLTNGKKFAFKNADCLYGYRNSFFKMNKKYVITAVTFVLSKKSKNNIEYTALKNRLAGDKNITPQKIREAVLDIRGEKLPDWHKIGTAGSFFKNPTILESLFNEIIVKYPNLPGFSTGKGKVKVSLAWILDNICNLKGYKSGQVGLYDQQPLCLVNLGKATAQDIIDFSNQVKNKVQEKTGIEIKEEVERL